VEVDGCSGADVAPSNTLFPFAPQADASSVIAETMAILAIPDDRSMEVLMALTCSRWYVPWQCVPVVRSV